MKKLLIASLLSLGLSSAYALQDQDQPPQPQKCPGPDAIRAVGVSRNVLQSSNLWFTGRRHQFYDTRDAWTFVLGNIIADSGSDAYNKAAAALATISYPVGPMVGPLSKWICWYTTHEGYTGVAITSPLAFANAKQFLN